MKETYLFSEDSRRYRVVYIILMIAAYLGFIASVVVTVLYHIGYEIVDGNRYLIVSIMCLIVAVYCTWGITSRYLKYYLFVTYDKIKFHANKKDNEFLLSDLVSYDIVKQHSQIMGGHYDYELKFKNGESFLISSFKGNELKEFLDKIKIKNS